MASLFWHGASKFSCSSVKEACFKGLARLLVIHLEVNLILVSHALHQQEESKH